MTIEDTCVAVRCTGGLSRLDAEIAASVLCYHARRDRLHRDGFSMWAVPAAPNGGSQPCTNLQRIIRKLIPHPVAHLPSHCVRDRDAKRRRAGCASASGISAAESTDGAVRTGGSPEHGVV